MNLALFCKVKNFLLSTVVFSISSHQSKVFLNIGFLLLLLILVIHGILKIKESRRLNTKLQLDIEICLKEIAALKSELTNIKTDNHDAQFDIEIAQLNENLTTKLSNREIDVLTELSEGKTNKEIADSLCVSISTVRTHLMNSYVKLNVKNRGQAIKMIHQFLSLKSA